MVGGWPLKNAQKAKVDFKKIEKDARTTGRAKTDAPPVVTMEPVQNDHVMKDELPGPIQRVPGEGIFFD